MLVKLLVILIYAAICIGLPALGLYLLFKQK